MYKFFVFGLLVAAVAAVPAPEQSRDLDCLRSDDLLSCVAVKATRAIQRATRSADVQVFEGVTFIRNGPVERTAKSLQSETEMMTELPRDATDRTLQLVSMLFDSAFAFFKSHSLKFDMPEGSISRAIDEGRAKIKKYLPLLAGAAGLKFFGIIPLALGALAILTIKALFVGKVALIIAAILAFQKLFGTGGSFAASNIFNKNNVPTTGWSDNTAQGWSAPAGQPQGYYKRSFEQDAHSLAYSAHAPTDSQ